MKINNAFKRLVAIGISTFVLNLIPFPLLAQVFSQSQRELDGTNIDDLPNMPQQMRTWRCSQGNQAVAVEAKDTSIWQEVIETNGWQCLEQLSVISDNERKFSCEPNEGNFVAIITTIWLEGKEGKQQMQTWMNALQSKNMTCTTSMTNQDWN